MKGELALLRGAIERMAVERSEVHEQPDYSETLASMTQKIDATSQRADALVTAAKGGSSPRHVVDRIVRAGADARAEDRRSIVRRSRVGGWDPGTSGRRGAVTSRTAG